MSAGRDLASCQRRPQSTQQSHGDQSHCKLDLTTESSVFCAVAAKMAMIAALLALWDPSCVLLESST